MDWIWCSVYVTGHYAACVHLQLSSMGGREVTYEHELKVQTFFSFSLMVLTSKSGERFNPGVCCSLIISLTDKQMKGLRSSCFQVCHLYLESVAVNA